MSDLLFEPYAVQQRWSMPGPLPAQAWQALLSGYLEDLAGRCEAAGAEQGGRVLIGHIKLLALFDANEYLRISAIKVGIPPTTDGRAPAGLKTMETTLNALVYGLPRTTLRDLAAAAAADAAGQWQGRVEDGPMTASEGHVHQS